MIIDVSITIQRSGDCQNAWSEFKKRVLFFAKQDSNLKILIRQRSDGGRSSMVEPQIVVLVVAGSSPVGHPIFRKVKLLEELLLQRKTATLLKL
jgi:hypothetical protein